MHPITFFPPSTFSRIWDFFSRVGEIRKFSGKNQLSKRINLTSNYFLIKIIYFSILNTEWTAIFDEHHECPGSNKGKFFSTFKNVSSRVTLGTLPSIFYSLHPSLDERIVCVGLIVCDGRIVSRSSYRSSSSSISRLRRGSILAKDPGSILTKDSVSNLPNPTDFRP